MEPKKRGRGRPPTLPPGNRRNVKCVLVNGEMAKLRDACNATGLSQLDFSRASILHAVAKVLGSEPVPPLPKAPKK